jgi:hypothetical protein
MGLDPRQEGEDLLAGIIEVLDELRGLRQTASFERWPLYSTLV